MSKLENNHKLCNSFFWYRFNFSLWRRRELYCSANYHPIIYLRLQAEEEHKLIKLEIDALRNNPEDQIGIENLVAIF